MPKQALALSRRLFVASPVIVVGVSARLCAAEPFCDPSLIPSENDLNAYQRREGRCEGIFIMQVGGSASLLPVHLTSSFDPFDPASTPALRVVWTAPKVATVVKLRAFGLARKLYYRMDTTLPAGDSFFSWPTDILNNLSLNRQDIGVIGWSPIQTGDGVRDVYVPLQIGSSRKPKRAGKYELIVVPGAELKQAFVTIQFLGLDWKAPKIISERKPLDAGFYPAERPLAIPVPEVVRPGYYLVGIGATLRHGGSATEQICLYHPP